MLQIIIALLKHVLAQSEPIEAALIAKHFSLSDAEQAAKLFDDVLKIKQGQ